jgi:hypothetical protein
MLKMFKKKWEITNVNCIIYYLFSCINTFYFWN